MNRLFSSGFRRLALFLAAVSVTLLLVGAVFTLSQGHSLEKNFFMQFLINFPVCVFLGLADVGIVKLARRKMRIRPAALRILADLVLTGAIALFLPASINFVLTDVGFGDCMKTALPIIPWSIITVLLIEIFFFSMEQMEAEKEKAGYQYEALKSQVNPHFLFNCLNVLSSLVWTDAEKANLFAKKLSGVYRYILSTRESDTVALDEEMEFVRSYIYLEKIRFEGRFEVDIRQEPGSGNRTVVPASIQALVENALKHNVCSKEHPLRITLTAGKDGISVSNSIRLRDNVPGYGIGLGNIRQQYALHGRDIEVVRGQDTFTVRMPYIR